jgi:hypothetical protein
MNTESFQENKRPSKKALAGAFALWIALGSVGAPRNCIEAQSDIHRAFLEALYPWSTCGIHREVYGLSLGGNTSWQSIIEQIKDTWNPIEENTQFRYFESIIKWEYIRQDKSSYDLSILKKDEDGVYIIIRSEKRDNKSPSK